MRHEHTPNIGHFRHDTTQMIQSEFSRRVGSWAVALLTVYLAYSATHFWGRPDPVAGFLAMLATNLPGLVALVLPPAVFAGALSGCGLLGGDRTEPLRRYWILLVMLSLATYTLGALVEPMLAKWTASDWAFPSSLLRSARSARAAAEAATGSEAARHLRGAARHLVRLYVPIANAAFVIVAAVLGDLTGRLTREMTTWPRYATRWLAGGLLVAAFWIPAQLANELVAYYAAWGNLLLLLPLCLPLVSAGILFAIIRPDRGSVR